MENPAYCPFCGSTVGHHKDDCYVRMVAHNFRNANNRHSKMYTGAELIKAWNQRAPVATDEFYIIPKPKKPLLTKVIDYASGKMSAYPQMDNIVSYYVKLQDWEVSKVLVKALAEAYGFEVKEKDE